MVGIKFTKVQTHYRVSDQINASCLNVRIYAPSVSALQQIILHYYFATLGPSTYSSFVIKNVVCFKCQLPPHGKQGVEISVTRCWNKKVTIVLPMLPKKKPWQILHKM